MISFQDASTKDVDSIRDIALKTWWPTYASILDKEQIQYMLENIYSVDELKKLIEEGSQPFLLLKDERGSQAFTSYSLKDPLHKIFKLNKLYVLPGNQGKGFGKLLVAEVIKRIRPEASALDLNVHRKNPARKFYEKLGFRVIQEEDIPFGPYTLNDYVMRLSLKNE